MGLSDLSKYAPLCTLIAAICALLSVFGLTYDLPGHYNSLDIHGKMLLLWSANLIAIFTIFMYFEIKIKSLNTGKSLKGDEISDGK